MNGYNVIYRKRKGCFQSVIMGRPIASVELPPDVEEEVVRMVFQRAHPSWRIVTIIPGHYSELSAFTDEPEV